MFILVTDRQDKPALVNVSQIAHLSATREGGTYIKFGKEDGVTAKEPIADILNTLKRLTNVHPIAKR